MSGNSDSIIVKRRRGAVVDVLPEEIEAHRDRMWRREPELRVEDANEAERLINDVGFCSAMTDARTPGPSLYIAVCGRRDAYMPRNVQKDQESSLTWTIKDEVMRRGRVYYAKLAKGRATFVSRSLVPHFNALWGVPRREERLRLPDDARAVLKVLRREWEMATADLRKAAGIPDRKRFTRALDELQKTLKVVPGEVLYQPWFTYIWTLAEGRFQQELSVKVKREEALREVARAFLNGAGMTLRGELAKVSGLSRPDAGLGNQALVAQGYAERLSTGVYKRKAEGGRQKDERKATQD
ncbi:MAG TPA: crosslink repair DNA glycosylase YcaQ family protein [Pyrinomonadaceae bacterium]|jgi:hypothetical protein|nr:crosslink repair DNA glycosylase YcaQ family protein [Pyrinomonadaceae bacterium]